MAEEQGAEMRAAFERAVRQAAAGKMRAAAALIEGGELPSDEALTDAGVLCADAGSLVESVYDERLNADAPRDDAEDEGEVRA